jgi:hypothetical protein
MAFLNVSDVLLDPNLASTFNVERRTETITAKGRSQVATQVFGNIVGVVTATSPNDLARLDDYQITQRAITIVTKFRLQGEVTGKQPDVIDWRGSRYVVKHIDYYPQFGNGFIQADCISMDITDGELPPLQPGAMMLNNTANSAFITL